MSELEMKRFLYTSSVEEARGSQQWYIDATTREEADERARNHDTDGIYFEQIEVLDVSRLEFDEETTTDDFGDFPPAQPPSASSSEAGGVVVISINEMMEEMNRIAVNGFDSNMKSFIDGVRFAERYHCIANTRTDADGEVKA